MSEKSKICEDFLKYFFEVKNIEESVLKDISNIEKVINAFEENQKIELIETIGKIKSLINRISKIIRDEKINQLKEINESIKCRELLPSIFFNEKKEDSELKKFDLSNICSIINVLYDVHTNVTSLYINDNFLKTQNNFSKIIEEILKKISNLIEIFNFFKENFKVFSEEALLLKTEFSKIIMEKKYIKINLNEIDKNLFGNVNIKTYFKYEDFNPKITFVDDIFDFQKKENIKYNDCIQIFLEKHFIFLFQNYSSVFESFFKNQINVNFEIIQSYFDDNFIARVGGIKLKILGDKLFFETDFDPYYKNFKISLNFNYMFKFVKNYFSQKNREINQFFIKMLLHEINHLLDFSLVENKIKSKISDIRTEAITTFSEFVYLNPKNINMKFYDLIEIKNIKTIKEFKELRKEISDLEYRLGFFISYTIYLYFLKIKYNITILPYEKRWFEKISESKEYKKYGEKILKTLRQLDEKSFYNFYFKAVKSLEINPLISEEFVNSILNSKNK